MENVRGASVGADGGRVVIRSASGNNWEQGNLSAGISSATVGSRALCMHVVVMPPGTRGTPHFHQGHETAIYVATGEVEFWHGADLACRTMVREGDFLYIPPDTAHVPVNWGPLQMVAIVARTDPAEQESVVELDLPSHLGSLKRLPVADMG